jgi:hypothetical protein
MPNYVNEFTLSRVTPNVLVLNLKTTFRDPNIVLREQRGVLCRQEPNVIEHLVLQSSVSSTAGPRPGTGPWYQLYRAASGSPESRHFSFLSIFHE